MVEFNRGPCLPLVKFFVGCDEERLTMLALGTDARDPH
jgi:hypothetical protein